MFISFYSLKFSVTLSFSVLASFVISPFSFVFAFLLNVVFSSLFSFLLNVVFLSLSFFLYSPFNVRVEGLNIQTCLKKVRKTSSTADGEKRNSGSFFNEKNSLRDPSKSQTHHTGRKRRIPSK
jgi:hypothetical protein